jgi:DNA-directed RNA polymerase specialized sigma24 family protein
MPDNSDPIINASGRFPSTHWSLITRAGSSEAPDARAALAELCSAYWYPVYAFIRRKGNGHDQALDLTQGFFARLLEKGTVASAEPGKGRFRAFLRTDCQHFLIDQFRRRTAWGSEISTVSIDARGAEDRYRFEPADTLTPDRLIDRAWALTLLDKVLDLLAGEYASKGRSELFGHLKIALTQGKGAVPAATLAAELGKTEEAVNMAVHRLRKRYREILEEQIGTTLDDPSEMEDEIRSLFAAITSRSKESC